MNPFDLTGPPFLTLYLALLIAAVVAGILIPRALRPPGREARLDDADALAWLAGGRARFVDGVVARLLARGALVLVGRERFAPVPGASGTSAVEHAALAAREPTRWGELEQRVRPYAEPIERQLRAAGLLMTADERASLRFRSTLPYALLIAFGATKHLIGEARERPVGFLTVLLVLTTIAAIMRWFTVDTRTRAGIDLVRDRQRSASRLKRAPTNEEFGIAVALFGTGVLAGSALADFHRLRSAGDGGSSGGGDSGSGDGGGGGGCGGCGS